MCCDSTQLELGFCSDSIWTRPCKILAQSTTSADNTSVLPAPHILRHASLTLDLEKVITNDEKK